MNREINSLQLIIFFFFKGIGVEFIELEFIHFFSDKIKFWINRSTVKPTYKQPQGRPKKVAYMKGYLYPDRVKNINTFWINPCKVAKCSAFLRMTGPEIPTSGVARLSLNQSKTLISYSGYFDVRSFFLSAWTFSSWYSWSPFWFELEFFLPSICWRSLFLPPTLRRFVVAMINIYILIIQ